MRFYSSKAWRKLRAQQIYAHPLCARCGARGEDVDHIESIRRAPKRALDPTNLRVLCHACHGRVTALYDRPTNNPQRGAAATGAPLDPTHPWHKGALEHGQVQASDLLRWGKGQAGKGWTRHPKEG